MIGRGETEVEVAVVAVVEVILMEIYESSMPRLNQYF
jgi:hypothetical protein